MSKVWITSDCTCDLSKALLDEYDLEVIHFYISTDRSCFKDMAEITATNVVEYFENGGQRISTAAPAASEYVEFFERMLQKHEKIIHVAIGSSVSMSYMNAIAASKQFDGKVQIFDTGHLSTGMAHMVIRAVELARENKTSEEILKELEEMKSKVSTSFIAYNADYLYRTGKVSKSVKDVCFVFKIHPVFAMINGEMKLKTVQIGAYDKAILRYVRKELRKPERIKKDRIFITYSTCPVRLLTKVNEQIRSCASFDKIVETKASATVTSNCGANAIGVLFVRE